MFEEIINNLEYKINDSIKKYDLSILENISKPTLLCGVGGSNIVSIFLSKVLNKKNNIITKCIDAEEFFINDFSNYNNLIILSHSGKNIAVKRLLNNSKLNNYLITTRKSKIKNETLINYSFENRIKSFISLDDTIIPISLILSHYLNSDYINIETNNENFNINKFDTINIIYDYSSYAAASFLEVAFIESGNANVNMHTKYSLCHGRTNIISNKKSLVLFMQTKENELDSLLIENIKKINDNFLLIKCLNDDYIISDYNLLIKSLYFLEYCNKKFNMEFINVKYNNIIPTIYNFDGELR